MASQPDSSNPANQDGIHGRFRWSGFVLGLVFPGLGHVLIGERGRAYRIMAGFLLLWIGGLLIGGLGSVRQYDPAEVSGGGRAGRNLWFYAQLGAGPIGLVTDRLYQSFILDAPEEMKIPISQPQNRVGLIYKDTAIGHASEFGTLFCALAGLLNVAVALDAGRRGQNERRDSAPAQAVKIRRANRDQSATSGEAQPR